MTPSPSVIEPDMQSTPSQPTQAMVQRKVFIETLGCQMNKSDSELMLGLLADEGFSPTSEKLAADLLIINTCQIRGSAEDKAYSNLGRWGVLKRKNPNLKIAMAGCVAQQTKEQVFKRMPYIDMVLGTQNIHDLPNLVRQCFDADKTHLVAADRQKPRSTYDYFSDVTAIRESDVCAWVTAIEGCDYFCTYCVVPYTRGRQISRPPESIIAEVQGLADAGFKEVTILGQTVDAYGKDFAEREYRLHHLFEALNAIDGLERIRFSTSHPLDLTDAIIDAVATLPKVMPHIHIPMQAGNSEVLDRMRRGYTAEEYYALTDKIHERIPGVAISGDYIVGFPDETDAQFEESVASIHRSGVYMANVAAYSPRQQTPAAIWEQRGEEIPAEVKESRLHRLNDVIRDAATKHNAMLEGQTVDVLVEGASRRRTDRLMGRTPTNKVVNFTSTCSEDDLVGKVIPVRITTPQPFSLLGEHVED